jgi:hypothetical protein
MAIDIEGIVGNFESACGDALQEAIEEVPKLGEWEYMRDVERALEDASGQLYSTLEEIVGTQFEDVCERVFDALFSSSDFHSFEQMGDVIEFTDEETGIPVRINIEDMS